MLKWLGVGVLCAIGLALLAGALWVIGLVLYLFAYVLASILGMV